MSGVGVGTVVCFCPKEDKLCRWGERQRPNDSGCLVTNNRSEVHKAKTANEIISVASTKFLHVTFDFMCEIKLVNNNRSIPKN